MNSLQKPLNPDNHNRLIEFLNESSHLMGIEGFDYHQKELQSSDHGFYRASLEAINKANRFSTLTVDDILKWHHWIVKEQEKSPIGGAQNANPSLLKLQSKDLNLIKEALFTYLMDLSHSLPSPGTTVNDLKMVEVIADHFRSFIELNLFDKGNHLMAFLLVNYMASWCRIPFFVFRSNEKSKINEVIKDLISTRLYFAQKRREAVFGEGGKLMLVEYEDFLNTTYKDKTGKKLTIHWNDFVMGQEAWKK